MLAFVLFMSIAKVCATIGCWMKQLRKSWIICICMETWEVLEIVFTSAALAASAPAVWHLFVVRVEGVEMID